MGIHSSLDLERLERASHYDYLSDEDLYEWQMLCHKENLIKEGKVPLQLTEEEELAYHQHMKGEIPWDGTSERNVHLDSGTNLKDGRTIFGLRKKRNMPK